MNVEYLFFNFKKILCDRTYFMDALYLIGINCNTNKSIKCLHCFSRASDDDIAVYKTPLILCDDARV